MENAVQQSNPLTQAPHQRTSFVERAGKYLLGKGVVSLAVIAMNSFAAGALWPVAIGFLGWRMFREYERYSDYQKDMLHMYCEDVAERLNMPVSEVTTAHLRKVADGDPMLGLPPNAIIAEALDRQRATSFLSVLTSAIAATATFGLLSFDTHSTVSEWLKSGLSKISDSLLEHSELIQEISVGIVSAASSLILHDGLDAGIGHFMGLSRTTAHDRINHIAKQRERGKAVSAEQVFDVFLAANPELAQQVQQQFNQGFLGFSTKERRQAMQAIGIEEMMQQMADSINEGNLRVASLTFSLDASQIEDSLKSARKEAFAQTRGQLHSNGYQHQSMAQAQTQEKPGERPRPSSRRFREMVGKRASQGSFVQAEQQREQARQLPEQASIA